MLYQLYEMSHAVFQSGRMQLVFIRRHLAVMDLPAEFYLETIKIVFQKHLLADNRLSINNRKVDLGAIRSCARMTIEGEKDDISGIGKIQAAHVLMY